tara:strand:+ start:2040 stop:2285 length:246 start_codon:yes stop_codon:yes gene_type:complete
MIKPETIKSAIQNILPDAEILVDDLGGGDHLQVSVISDRFEGLSLIQQHKIVYSALKDELATEAIHALALSTSTSKQSGNK